MLVFAKRHRRVLDVQIGQGLSAGEEAVGVDLRSLMDVRLARRPHYGYSAFREPFIVFAGIAAAALAFPSRPGKAWGWLDWLQLIVAFLVGSFGTREILSRLFPRWKLVLTTGALPKEIDVHSLPKAERAELERELRALIPPGGQGGTL